MKIYRILAEKPRLIVLGYAGENRVTAVEFDFTKWNEEFGSGGFSAVMTRPGDNLTYPILLEISGTIATWTISDADVAYKGRGQIQLIYESDYIRKKSSVVDVIIENSISSDTSDPPDPYENWKDDAARISAEVSKNASAAAESIKHSPKIVENEWYIWDPLIEDYVATGISANGLKGDKGDKGDTGSQGIQGETGETGNGIVSINKTSSEGFVDTYTIEFTDGSSTTFTVTNGSTLSFTESDGIINII